MQDPTSHRGLCGDAPGLSAQQAGQDAIFVAVMTGRIRRIAAIRKKFALTQRHRLRMRAARRVGCHNEVTNRAHPAWPGGPALLAVTPAHTAGDCAPARPADTSSCLPMPRDPLPTHAEAKQGNRLGQRAGQHVSRHSLARTPACRAHHVRSSLEEWGLLGPRRGLECET